MMQARFSSALHVLAIVAAISVASTTLANVNFIGVPSGAAPGDYNNDGITDAADYTVWRDGGSPDSSQAGYQLWRNNYGATGGGGNVFAFENPANWTTADAEPAPPASNSLWFGEGNEEDIVLVLTDERSGENGTEMLGTFAIGGDTGGNDFNSKFTFVINNSVTFTAQETDGGVIDPPGTRSMRIGRENLNPVGTSGGGTTETAPWGIVKVQHGTFKYDTGLTNGIDMSRDKPNSAGSIFEVNGDAVLDIEGPVRFGDRDNGNSRTTPGAIFRVRGSNASVEVEDFINESRLGLWDHDNDITADNPFGVTHMNLGKFVTEFVLDANGVSPIVVNDELRLGRSEDLAVDNREFGYAFLRLKLSEPTTAGSGAVGSGDEIVLFQADRISSLIDADNDPNTVLEIEEGRFLDPDRAGRNFSDTGPFPHDSLRDGGTARADYAGAQYQWTINYFDSSDDGILVDAVTLSNLQIVGTPGDLSGNDILGSEDRQLLVDAIANPPAIAIATAQNLFDLNADEVVDSMDLAVFDAYFPGLGLTAGIAAPEPASAALLGLALLSIGMRRRV